MNLTFTIVSTTTHRPDKCKTTDLLPQIVGIIYGSLHFLVFIIVSVWAAFTISKHDKWKKHTGRYHKQLELFVKDLWSKRKMILPMLSILYNKYMIVFLGFLIIFLK